MGGTWNMTDFFDASQSGLLDRCLLPSEPVPSEEVPEASIPAANSGTLLLPLCLPSIAFGMVSVLAGTWMFHCPSASLLTFAGCLTGLLTTIVLFRRQEAAAAAVLHRADLRGADLIATGVFRTLLGEMIHLVSRHESKTRWLTEQRSRSDARAHLLKNQVRRMVQTLDQVEQPVILLDASSTMIYRNSAGDALLKSAACEESVVVDTSWESVPGLKNLVDSVRNRSAAAKNRTAELELKTGSQTITYRATATNLYEDDNRLAGVCILLADICEEVQEKGKQAQFVSSVSHELKTPLASIRAYTELLMDDDVDEPKERLELLKFIDEQVDRLTRLVNNLLNFSRVESGVIKVQREDVDVNRIIKQSMEVVASAARQKRITLVDELSELYLPAHLDLDLFGQAIINLLSNAIKYTPAGGEVRIRSRMQDTEAVIEVHDNGMGIPPESLPRLFERFYRVPQNSKAAPGTGLGLALVKYIVTNIHDGSITVASQVNRGSNFAIRIPLGHRGRNLRQASTQKSTN